MNSSNPSVSRLLLGLLTIVFITLKLTHTIDWSWWLVLIPIWGISLLLILTFFLGFAGFVINKMVQERIRAISRAKMDEFNRQRAELALKLRENGLAK